MFKFLKEKLKSAISKISEGVEKAGEVEERIIEKPAEEPKKEEEKGFFAKLKETFSGKEEALEGKRPVTGGKAPYSGQKMEQIPESVEDSAQELANKLEKVQDKKMVHTDVKKEIKHSEPTKHIPKPEIKEPSKKSIEETSKIIEKEPGKKGFFAAIKEKIVTTKINEGQFERLFWELELALMENNVAVEVIEKIKNDLKEELVEKPIKRTRVEETIQETLKGSIEGLFQSNDVDLVQEIKNKKEKPYVIAFFGINGSGKTTSIAKLANMLKEKNISCVLAASDTFRAASIEQLQLHADRIGVKLIKHDYGSDPAAVAFDAIKHAKAKDADVVLIDTAGRMHSNVNLVDEMKKIIRVAKPDLKIFVGESITGNDCIEQAKTFNDAVGIDGIILAKADIDEKGGAAVSVSYITKKPILYLGTGQRYSDLQVFNSEVVVKGLGLS